MVTDPRKVLGVSETASQDEIKRAYRRKPRSAIRICIQTTPTRRKR